MSTTEDQPQIVTIDGIPVQMVLDNLTERGQLEVQLAVARAKNTLLISNNEVLQEQVSTLDAQVVSLMEEKNGVGDGVYAADPGAEDRDGPGSPGGG